MNSTSTLSEPASQARATPSAGRVSLVIGTFNRARYIGECIDSMLAQTRPIDEIWVVDDGSTDDTAERVRAYGEKVRYVHKPNGGRASALNFGLERCTGDWVWFFDDDDVAEPDALERMLAALDRDPAADFAYSSQIIGRERADGELVRERVVKLPPVAPERLFVYAQKQYPFLTQGMLIGRPALQAVGGFDLRYLRGQDYELYMRLFRRYRGVPVQGPTFVWRVHDGPRGPKQHQHDGAKRGKVWMEYSAMMGRELRAELPLGEYLYPKLEPHQIDPIHRRRALVHRMAVMGCKVLIPEMLEDLRALSGLGVNAREKLRPEEADACRTLMMHEYFLDMLIEQPAELTRQLMDAGRPGGEDVLLAMGQGLLATVRYSTFETRTRVSLALQAIRLVAAGMRSLF